MCNPEQFYCSLSLQCVSCMKSLLMLIRTSNHHQAFYNTRWLWLVKLPQEMHVFVTAVSSDRLSKIHKNMSIEAGVFFVSSSFFIFAVEREGAESCRWQTAHLPLLSRCRGNRLQWLCFWPSSKQHICSALLETDTAFALSYSDEVAAQGVFSFFYP